MLQADRNPCVGSNRKTWRWWAPSGGLQLDGKHTLWALHVRRFPIPGWLSSRMRNLRIRRADCTPSFCVKDLNFKSFGVHRWGGRGVCPGTSHLQMKKASFLKEQESFLEADIILARSRLGNVGWKRPGRSLEVFWLQREDKLVLHLMAGAVGCSPWTLLPTPMPASDCRLPCRLWLSALVSAVAAQVLLCLSRSKVVPALHLLDWFFPRSRTFYPHMVLFQNSMLKYCLLSLEAFPHLPWRAHSPMSLDSVPLPFLVFSLVTKIMLLAS